MNILAYIIYLLITYLITVKVGLILFRNGRIFILEELHHDETLTDAVNKMLLTGYYLLNLGYAAIMLSFWEHITTFPELVSSISTMVGRIVFGLALMHYFNIMAIYLYSKRSKQIHHHKKQSL